MTIYLVMPANTATYGPICSIFFEQMLRLTTAKSENSQDVLPINAIIDEFANLPKMPSLAHGVSFLRSYKIRVCTFVQLISQLKDVYGDSKKDSLMAAPIKVAFNVSSFEDAKYFSALAGKKTVKVKNESTQQNLNFSTNTHKQLKDLISPDEVMRLNKGKMLIFRTGFNVVKARKNFWFHCKRYKNLC